MFLENKTDSEIRGTWAIFDFELLASPQNVAAPPFAVFEGWVLVLMLSGAFADTKFGLLRFVHQYGSTFSFRIAAKAAPVPLLWFEHQPPITGLRCM